MTLLGLWVAFFGHALFFAPREDGSGLGGSVYWVVEVTEKVAFMGGIVTCMLIWATGQWERGIRWPRRWVGHSNRGLRGFNCKLVVIKRPWWQESLSTIKFIFSTELFSPAGSSTYRFVNNAALAISEKTAKGLPNLPNIREEDARTGREEDLAPGGDYVKLLLLPKPFSPTFRENWDMYRTEYWERENERRAALRAKVNVHDRQIAKQQGGWLWWTGWRGWQRNKGHSGRGGDVEKTHLHHRLSQQDLRRHRSGSIRTGSHSRTSSRGSTPGAEIEDQPVPGRRGSTASVASERRKKKVSSSSSSSPRTKLSPAGSRSGTPTVPEAHSPLVRNNSHTSISSLDSDRPVTPLLGEKDSMRSLRASAKPGGSNARKPLASNTFDP